MAIVHLARIAVLASGLLSALFPGPAGAAEFLYATEGNRLHRIEVGSLTDGTPRHEVLIERSPRADEGLDVAGADRRRDINGMVCRLPDGSGRFIAGEDTGQPTTPPGWGVFTPGGRQIGKLTATYRAELGEPYGCAFDAQGRLFTTEIGNAGFGRGLGQLMLWFPPYDRFPGPAGAYPDTAAASDHFCKIATDIHTAAGIVIDAEGRVYVAASSGMGILRFSPPFPTGPTAEEGCAARDSLGSPLATEVSREVFKRGLYTFSGLAFAPSGNLYAASVFTGEILELDPAGAVVRKILDPAGWLPPFETGTPQGIAVDAAGNVYYADLDLVWDFPAVDTGPDGKLRLIRFDASGEPLPPQTILDGLAFPDGVSVLPGGDFAP